MARTGHRLVFEQEQPAQVLLSAADRSGMVGSAFFTALDPSPRLQGSRDPLGVQPVWSALGRPLIGNLTLTSSDAASFRTLLVGYLLGERKAEPCGKRVRLPFAGSSWRPPAGSPPTRCRRSAHYGSEPGWPTRRTTCCPPAGARSWPTTVPAALLSWMTKDCPGSGIFHG